STATEATRPELSKASIFMVSSPFFSVCPRDETIVKSFGQVLFNGDLNALLRKDLFNEACPLNKADASALQIFVKTYLEHFLRVADAVHIKMVKGQSPFLVFLYDSKC